MRMPMRPDGTRLEHAALHAGDKGHGGPARAHVSMHEQRRLRVPNQCARLDEFAHQGLTSFQQRRKPPRCALGVLPSIWLALVVQSGHRELPHTSCRGPDGDEWTDANHGFWP
jgi:hypothetical protein